MTLLDKVGSLQNKENASIIMDLYSYMCEKGSSENHKINNLKVLSITQNTLGMLVCMMSIKKTRLFLF